MKAILLSIKPEYVEKILDGTKKYEYRKRLAKAESSTILIYSTSPVMKVVAKAEITGTICAAPSTLWEKTKGNAGISSGQLGPRLLACDELAQRKVPVIFLSPFYLYSTMWAQGQTFLKIKRST